MKWVTRYADRPENASASEAADLFEPAAPTARATPAEADPGSARAIAPDLAARSAALPSSPKVHTW